METEKKAVKVQKLFCSNNGRVVCGEHGGRYLEAELASRPNGRRFKTPLDVWEVATAADPDAKADYMNCERCGAHL